MEMGMRLVIVLDVVRWFIPRGPDPTAIFCYAMSLVRNVCLFFLLLLVEIHVVFIIYT